MSARRERGFTLIELMIGLAIFAFLILIAGPMYADFMGNSQIRNGAESALTGVRLAQTEALRGNTHAQFVLDPAVGWQVLRCNDDTGSFDLVQSYKFSDGAPKTTVTSAPGDATKVRFDGLGRIVPNDSTASSCVEAASATISEIDVTNTNVASSSRRPLHVVIQPAAGTSAIKLCDPAVTEPTDPRICPS